MRLLHVYNQYALFTRGGGVERYIHQLCSLFAARGHAVTVAAATADEGFATPYRLVAARGFSLLREIHGAEVVHIHGPRMRYAAGAGLLALLMRKKLYYTLHCFYAAKTPLGRLLKWGWDHSVERLLLSRADGVIVLSDYWRRYLALHHLPTARVVIVPNGVSVAALVAEPSAAVKLAGSPAILSVSRLDPVKRVEDPIAALAQPGLEKAQLHIVGRGADQQRLEALAVQLGVAERVTFHGFQEDAAIAAMARGADMFVIASEEEGMPTTILEMLGRRVPVVASQIPGNLSLTNALGWDYTYPLADIPALAATITRAHRAEVSTVLLEKLTEQFDWPSLATRMLTLYEEKP